MWEKSDRDKCQSTEVRFNLWDNLFFFVFLKKHFHFERVSTTALNISDLCSRCGLYLITVSVMTPVENKEGRGTLTGMMAQERNASGSSCVNLPLIRQTLTSPTNMQPQNPLSDWPLLGD